MKLINTDGMAFIGPGSEWFWTALSGLVLAVTFLAIYRQLRLQSHAGAIDQMNSFEHELTSERYLRYRLDVLVALRSGTDPAQVPDGAAFAVANFWERIATLTRTGHLDRRLLWHSIGASSVLWWMRLVPWVLRERADQGNPSAFEHFEWLSGVTQEQARRQGLPTAFDEATLAGWLDGDIARYQDQIRVEQALRAVIVTPPEIVTGEQAAMTAPAPPKDQEEAAPAGPPA